MNDPFNNIAKTMRYTAECMLIANEIKELIKQSKQKEMKDLTKILRDGDEVYSIMHGIYGKIEVGNDSRTPIKISLDNGTSLYLTHFGGYSLKGECLIFPSKEERNWDNFKRTEEIKKGDLCAFWSINITHKVVGIFCDEEGGEYFSASILDGEISRYECWDNCEKINIEDYI